MKNCTGATTGKNFEFDELLVASPGAYDKGECKHGGASKPSRVCTEEGKWEVVCDACYDVVCDGGQLHTGYKFENVDGDVDDVQVGACSEGYKTTGAVSRRCNHNGTWVLDPTHACTAITEKDKLPWWAWLIIALGALAILAILGMILYFSRRKTSPA